MTKSTIHSLGNAQSKPGSIEYGRWEALQHPTGHTEFLPVILAQGKKEGPCLWLTAGIHGVEHTGLLVIHKLLTQELVDRLYGTVVAIPALNPAGLRTMKRVPYHAEKDPNRLWPDGKPVGNPDPYKDPPSSLEMAYRRLFDELVGCVDYMIDYHNAWTGSLSFGFRDRILYRGDQNADVNKAETEVLSARQAEMLKAYGHTTVVEMPVSKFIDEDLHRSTSAAVLLLGKVPAITVELGTGHMPDPLIISAAVAGTRNIMRWAGMLDGEMEPITGIPVIDPGFRVRRCPAPRAREACVINHLLQPGDRMKVGDPLAEVRDVWGRPIGDGLLLSEYEGFVLARSHGIFYYPGDPVFSLAVKDELPIVAPYPEDYFKLKDE